MPSIHVFRVSYHNYTDILNIQPSEYFIIYDKDERVQVFIFKRHYICIQLKCLPSETLKD